MTASPDTAFQYGLAALPEPLRAVATAAWSELASAGMTAGPWAEVAARVLALSEFVTRNVAAQPALLVELVASGDLERAYADGELHARIAAAAEACIDEAALKTALRQLRRREMVRIAWRDLAGRADLAETLAGLSALADACIEAAQARLTTWLSEREGVPREPGGAPAVFVVLGMGKLGGGELNFSSDIDLIFAYSEEGETDKRALSNHEYFVRLGQRLITVLNEATGDGFVFRVDMRLRPNGASGPLALSFDAMEQYYQAHGRMWERYALIKARCVAGDMSAGDELLQRLKPFVFRRYLDYTAVEEIRGMKLAIHAGLGPGAAGAGAARPGRRGAVHGRGVRREFQSQTDRCQLLRSYGRLGLRAAGRFAAREREWPAVQRHVRGAGGQVHRICRRTRRSGRALGRAPPQGHPASLRPLAQDRQPPSGCAHSVSSRTALRAAPRTEHAMALARLQRHLERLSIPEKLLLRETDDGVDVALFLDRAGRPFSTR